MQDIKVAFWNVCNLFEVGSVDRAPKSSPELDEKIRVVANCINNFHGGSGPDVLGLAEIQNEILLKSLITRLSGKYAYLWTSQNTSITTGLAFLYKPTAVTKVMNVAFEMNGVQRPRALMVECLMSHNPNDSVVFFVCHWKSRMSGGDADRLASGAWIRDRIDSYGLRKCVILMGDFNAEPFEPPFGSVSLRASRHFGSAFGHNKLYNAAWRLLLEPDLWDTAGQCGYALPRARTSHDASTNVVFDQFLVSGAALRGGPLLLIESSICYHTETLNTYRTPRRISPRRFEFDGVSNTSVGASDHFPIAARFTAN